MSYEVMLLKGQPIQHSIRGARDTFVGTLKFGELVDRYQIPHRVHSADEGYQRKASATRINKLVRDLHGRRVDLPTAILLSIRDADLYPRLDSSGRYILTLPANGKRLFYVVDGQHRLEALKKVLDEDPEGDWRDFKIPAVIIFGADDGVEMDQFHIVNSNQKGISSDLTLDLMKTRAMRDDAYRKYLDGIGEGWKVISQDLTERVAKKLLWKGKIRFPGEPKGTTIINSNSFVTSLKRALDQVNFSTYLPEQRASIIDAYWRGVRDALPECFDHPNDFNIQKTVGVYVLHHLLPDVLEYASKFGNPVEESDTYRRILGDTLVDLTGDNQMNEAATGAGFWRVGAEGASGTYSSGAGQRVLREMIRRELIANLEDQLA